MSDNESTESAGILSCDKKEGTHDELSGLYNRRYFDEEMKKQDVDLQRPLSVIIGDINGLRLINDSFGHPIGDKTIIEVANIIKDSCRKSDIIARTGDDEFCIILPKADNGTTQRICRKIYDLCVQYRGSKAEGSLYTTISLGYSTRTISHEPIGSLIKEAEKEMFRHKLLETRSIRSSIISSIVSILYEKYEGTEEHSNRMKYFSRKAGLALGIPDATLDELELVSVLHDIGKVAISDAIINKNAKLTKEEKREMQNHAESGFRITQSINEFKHISGYVLSHHEKWDGTGYPQKLKGEEIPLVSRIISIVDAYDAMTMKRPYREALPEEYAVNEIKTCSGTQFDPKIARVFIEKVLGQNW